MDQLNVGVRRLERGSLLWNLPNKPPGRTGVSRAGIYQMIRDGLFPKPLSIGPRAVAWDSAEVDAWINSRARASNEAAVS